MVPKGWATEDLTAICVHSFSMPTTTSSQDSGAVREGGTVREGKAQLAFPLYTKPTRPCKLQTSISGCSSILTNAEDLCGCSPLERLALRPFSPWAQQSALMMSA